ncbi:hypothetical protein LCGC14_2533570 [marine sediment metagenome]|uniref:Uncharacterized protein n=1 Tax=marine sediment metagenome TaxID=412755 RepID=A0A0F9DKX0_9ZZZZ
MLCTRCKKKEATWDFKDEQFCQMCFEEWTSEEFWRLNVWQNGIKEEL